MIIRCEKCDTRFRLDDERVARRAVKVKCTKCHNIFIVYPPQPIEEAQVQEVQEVQETPSDDAPRNEEGAQGETPSREAEREEEEEEEGAAPPAPAETGFSSSPAPQEEGEEEEEKEEEEETGREAPFEEGGEEGSDSQVESQEEVPSERDLPGEARPGAADLKEDSEEGFTRYRGLSAGPYEGDDEESREFTEAGAPGEEPPKPEEGPAEPLKRATVSQARVRSAQTQAQRTLFDFERDEKRRGVDFAVRTPVFEKKEGRNIRRLFMLIAAIIAVSTVISYLMHRGDGPQPPIEIESIKGSYAENKTLGRLFVIEGNIRNTTDRPFEIKGIRGSIYDDGGDKVSEATVSPGRVATKAEIENLDAEALMRPFEDASEGVLPPGATMPVMVLFTEVPEMVSEYSIDVLRK